MELFNIGHLLAWFYAEKNRGGAGRPHNPQIQGPERMP